ncbi:FAD-dependent oxidoreductase [Jhaorihella thermophila]
MSDLIGWYRRQLEKLGVDLRYNSYMDANDITAFGADAVVLATGSQPPGTGFQKALPHLATLPGLEHGRVWSPEDVMTRAARPGRRVIVLDEGGNWRGCGTAWWLAELGHAVTIVTPDGLVGKELQRSATDWPLRRTLARLGVRFVTDSAIAEWTGQGARVLSLLTGDVTLIEADDLVMATTNHADMDLRDDLAARGIACTLIGDANAPRNAAYAIYEGRKAALAL